MIATRPSQRTLGASSRRWSALVAALALVATAGTAEAKPKRRDARAAFDRGLAAYKKNDYATASAQFSKSFDAEHDPDTLFAWAQSERKADHCDKAVELYQQLLTFDLPTGNRSAVEGELAGCRATLVDQQAAAEAARKAAEPPPPPPQPEPVALPPQPEPPVAAAAVTEPPPPPLVERVWYKDPVGLALTGTGVVALGVGAGFIVAARSHDQHANSAFDKGNYTGAEAEASKAKSRNTVGLVTGGIGAGLVVGGAIWLVMHRDTEHSYAWLTPGGGVVGYAGAF